MVFTITLLIIFFFSINFIFFGHSDWSKYKKPIHYTLAMMLIITMVWYVAWYGGRKQWYQFGFGDVCTFMAPFLIISLLLNKDQFLKYMAPWAFLGAVVYLFYNKPNVWDVYFNWDGRTTADHPAGQGLNFNWFISTDIKHLTFLVFSLAAIHTLPQYEKRDLKGIFGFIGIFFAYDFIVIGSLGLWVNPKFFSLSTILYPSSYHEGDYSFLGKLPIPYPIPTLILYTFGGLMIMLYFYCFKGIKKHKINKQKINNQKVLVKVRK